MNIKIKWPSNIICIHIFAIFQVLKYSDICSVSMWHPNIFGYSFSKLCGIQIYSEILSVHFMIFAHHWAASTLVQIGLKWFPRLPRPSTFFLQILHKIGRLLQILRAKLLQLFSPHPMNHQGSPYCHSFLTGTLNYHSKVIPISALHTEQIAKAFFFKYLP